MNDKKMILPIYSKNKNIMKLLQYQIEYDANKMNIFLEEIKNTYSQVYNDYGPVSEIKKLKAFSIIDLILAEDNQAKKDSSNLINYSYIIYPLIYKLFKNILNQKYLDLTLFINYYDAINKSNHCLLTYQNLSKMITNKNLDDLINNFDITNYHKVNYYTDNEKKLSLEDYQKILDTFISILNFNYIPHKTKDSEAYQFADLNYMKLQEPILSASTLSKKLQQKNIV